MSKKLYKSTKDKKLCGICGGLAEYMGVDPVIVRLVFVVVALYNVLGFLVLYFIFSIIIPTDEEVNKNDNLENNEDIG